MDLVYDLYMIIFSVIAWQFQNKTDKFWQAAVPIRV